MSRRVAVVLLLLAAACSSGSDGDTAAPTTVPVTEAPTVAPATSTTATTATTVKGVPRTTTSTTVALTPGEATISGTVNGPGGPVDGATVRIERLVGKEVAATEVRSAGGAYSVSSVLGGAYRVRAWRAPDLAQNGSEAFFLSAKEVKQLDLTLVQYGANGVVATVEPDPPKVEQPATLMVKLGVGQVDAQGKVTTTPKGGIPVTLTVGPGLVVESPPQLVSDATGSGAWRFRCTAPGTFPVTLTFGGATEGTAVPIPPCVA